MPAAVDLGRVEHLARQTEEALPQQERAEGDRRAGEDDALVGVDPGLAEDVGEGQVVRQDRHLVRDHQRRQQQDEDPSFLGKRRKARA